MSYKFLKSLRVLIAIASLLLIALAFLDFLGFLPAQFINAGLWLQFVPSVLLFSKVFTFSALGFLVVILLTSFFGRVYCASLCPLGVFQDVVLRLARMFKKIRFKYHAPFNWLRYGILVLTILTLLLGSSLLLNMLDPYSVFGRIVTDLFRPLLILGNNVLAGILQSREIYSVFHVDVHWMQLSLYIIPVGFLFLILYMSVQHGRLYCNTVCPLGAFLGLISKYSVYKIRINSEACTNCKACTRVCKAQCIDLEKHTVDASRCISCYNCLTSCKFDAIDLKTKSKAAKDGAQKGADVSRRRALGFLTGSIVLSPVGALARKVVSNNATVPVERQQYVTPPGSADVQEFLNRCTACHLCVSACPTGVIQPSKNEFGWQHFLQVRMDFYQGFCNFECVRCTAVCPTGALLPLLLENKKRTQIGRAEFVKGNCIVNTEGTDCGACSEHCPTKAVRMVPYKNGLTIPEVDESICIGCGACEYACPTQPYKAIYVKGNPVHIVADEPQREKAKKNEFEGDFPF